MVEQLHCLMPCLTLRHSCFKAVDEDEIVDVVIQHSKNDRVGESTFVIDSVTVFFCALCLPIFFTESYYFTDYCSSQV